MEDKGCGKELMFDGQYLLACGKSVNTYTGEEKVPINQHNKIILCKECKKRKAGVSKR
jgi:hypothetical protein